MSTPPSPDRFSAWQPLVIAIVSLLGAAVRVVSNGGPDWLSGGLWTAGIFLLGYWVERNNDD